jgi:hypothetical protein
MDITPNIFNAIVFDLHPRIREFIDNLDKKGQIDHDSETNTPHIMAVESPATSTFRCAFVRNGQPVHALIHTRRKAEPIISWNPNDGYKRKEIVVVGMGPRKERQFRAFESIMEQILSKSIRKQSL